MCSRGVVLLAIGRNCFLFLFSLRDYFLSLSKRQETTVDSFQTQILLLDFSSSFISASSVCFYDLFLHLNVSVTPIYYIVESSYPCWVIIFFHFRRDERQQWIVFRRKFFSWIFRSTIFRRVLFQLLPLLFTFKCVYHFHLLHRRKFLFSLSDYFLSLSKRWKTTVDSFQTQILLLDFSFDYFSSSFVSASSVSFYDFFSFYI